MTIDGAARQLMLVEKGRESSVFVDPADPSGAPIEWQGHWRTLTQAWTFAPLTENFSTAWSQLNFPRLLFNTIGIATLSTIGAVLSSVLVAYGFARFRFPGRNAFFVILLATIILPPQVTLLPQYVIFTWLGWNGTWLPLIIPHCFANAFNVFLLRQYFLSIPRDLDEAAMIDGAGPFRILRSIIVPQSIAAITAVSLFHFFFAWNDFFVPAPVPRQQAGSPAAVDRDPAVQRGVRDPADADPGHGADDDGRPDRHLLPRPAGVHARRRHHRGREVTVGSTGEGEATAPGEPRDVEIRSRSSRPWPGAGRWACPAPRSAGRASTCR